MLKKSLISLAVAASVAGISGCDISSTTSNAGNVPEVQQQNQAAIANKTFPLFNPARGQLPFGIDLLFASQSDESISDANKDGTADVGSEYDNPARAATNDLDGISVLAPIDVQFNNSIDPASIEAGGNVFLVKLPNAADVDPNNLILPSVGDVTTAADVNTLSLATLAPFFAETKPDGTAPASQQETVAFLNLFGANDGTPLSADDPNETDGIIAMQPVPGDDYEVDVVGLNGTANNTIRINPLKPLEAKTKYIVIVTTGVKASDGDSITPSPDYESVSGTDPLVSNALAPVRALVQNIETLASTIITKGGTDNSPLANDIAFSAPFTTTDPTAILGAMAAPAAALPAAFNPGNALSDTIEPQARNFEFIPAGQVPSSTFGLPGDVVISQGAIELPQYVEAFATDPNDSWSALDQSPVSDLDGTKNVTYRFPFAKEKRNAVVPVLMFEPTRTECTDGTIATGAPWSVVIIQHGFQSDRTGNLINASNIANDSCHAVIAIDLPHHGVGADAGDQLAFNVENAVNMSTTPWATAVDGVITANSGTPENTILDELAERHENFYLDSETGQTLPMDFDNAAGGSGTLFIRLDNFQRTRDNMRQGVMDLLNLNATLARIDLDGDGNGADGDGDGYGDTPDLNLADVKYIGHSLGAIVGIPFVSMNQVALSRGNTNLNSIQSTVMATPGGHMTKLIENSARLSGTFLPGLAAQSEGKVVQGKSDFASFMKTFQATLDSADPMNFTAALKSVGVPTLVFGMYGNGTTIPSDVVVPITGEGELLADGEAKPETAENPLTGLAPMLDILDAENVTGTPGGNIYVAKFNEGGHGNFSSAGFNTTEDPLDSTAAYTEMLNLTVDLLDDNAVTAGKTATVLIPEAP